MFPYITELRAILLSENERDIKRFKDLDWKLSLVTACRARQKTMVPKYTVKLDVQGTNAETQYEEVESFVMDTDYTNLKRL